MEHSVWSQTSDGLEGTKTNQISIVMARKKNTIYLHRITFLNREIQQEIKSLYPVLSPSVDMTKTRWMMVAYGCSSFCRWLWLTACNPGVTSQSVGCLPQAIWSFHLFQCISESVFPRETGTIFLLESHVEVVIDFLVLFCW